MEVPNVMVYFVLFTTVTIVTIVTNKLSWGAYISVEVPSLVVCFSLSTTVNSSCRREVTPQ